MLIVRSTSSQLSVNRGNSVGEASGGPPREPERKRTRFGLARAKTKVAKLPKMMKPAIHGQATDRSGRGTFRGGWGQRARKGQPGTWETRQRARAISQRRVGMHNGATGARPGVGQAQRSEEASNDRGAKGPEPQHVSCKRRREPIGPTYSGEAGERRAAGELSQLRQKLSQKARAGAAVQVLLVVRPDLPARRARYGVANGASQGRGRGPRRHQLPDDRAVHGWRDRLAR